MKPNRADTSREGRTNDTEIAVGVKVFTRTNRLEELLSSVPPGLVSTVYVADDGPEASKEKRRKRLYDESYPFDLVVLDLEYNTGVGYGRRQIVEEFTGEYLLMLDSDLQIPNNVGVLVELLEARPDLGAISGTLAEPPYNRITMLATDFEEQGDIIMLSPFHTEKEIQRVDGYPLLEFDLIPNTALYRRECLEAYSWDPNFEMEYDHQDMYLGHWKQTAWSFGICPQVVLFHYPGGDNDYFEQRWAEQKHGEEYFLEKWGYEAIGVVDYYWFDGGREPGTDPTQREIALRQSGPDKAFERKLKRGQELRHKQEPVLERAKQIYADQGALSLAKHSVPFLKNKLGLREESIDNTADGSDRR